MPTLGPILGYLRIADEANRRVGPAKADSTTYATEKNAIKENKFSSGNFALVVKAFSDSGDTVALRLFLGQIPAQTTQVTSHIFKHPHPALVSCKLKRKLFTLKSGDDVDAMEMEWVIGKNLDVFVSESVAKPDAAAILSQLSRSFITSIGEITVTGFYHGDLSHGNIMVESDGKVRVVDYDSVRIQGQPSTTNEVGVQDYQHPSRVKRKSLDIGDVFFSSFVIFVTLAALEHDPKLWERHLNIDDGVDGLLFHHAEKDLSSTSTPLWKEFDAIFAKVNDPVQNEAFQLLRSAVNSPHLTPTFTSAVQHWYLSHWNIDFGSINPNPPHPTPVPPAPVPPRPVPPNSEPPSPRPEVKPSPVLRPVDTSSRPKPSPTPKPRHSQQVKPSPKLRPVKPRTNDDDQESHTNNLLIRSIRIDEDGTEWWEDDDGTWWYRPANVSEWYEYNE